MGMSRVGREAKDGNVVVLRRLDEGGVGDGEVRGCVGLLAELVGWMGWGRGGSTGDGERVMAFG